MKANLMTRETACLTSWATTQTLTHATRDSDTYIGHDFCPDATKFQRAINVIL